MAVALQEISTLLADEKIVMRDPKTKSVYYNVEAGVNDSVKFASGEDYRAAAERDICCSSSEGLPIVIGGYLRVEIYRFWEYCGNHNMTIIY